MSIKKEKNAMRKKIIEYKKQLEKSYEENEQLRYQPINVNNCMNDYYQGRADSIKATINDLNDILNNRTYSERLDKILQKKE